MVDSFMLGRGFLKQQDLIRTIQFGVSRVVPFSEITKLTVGDNFSGKHSGRGKSEYRWGPDLPQWSQGKSKGYIDKYAQPFFQYYPDGTDYWGWYKRHTSEVWGDGRKAGTSAGYPGLYQTGQKGEAFKKTVGVKAGGKVGSFGNLTEEDIKFKSTTVGSQVFSRPALKKEGGGSRAWGSGDSWWSKYGNADIGNSKDAMKELWTSFFEYAEEGMGEVGMELEDSGKSALLKRTIGDRNKYKVYNPKSKRMVSLAESAGEIDLAMIIEDNATEEQTGGMPYQMINANPGRTKGNDDYRADYRPTGEGQDWVESGKYRKDLDFSMQFAEGQVMKSILEQKGIEFPDNFGGFEVSMFDITHESRILHFAKDSIHSIEDIGKHLKTVELALNTAVGNVAGKPLDFKQLNDSMLGLVQKYEGQSGKLKSGLSVMAGTTAALTGQETQQILSRLTTLSMNNNFGPSSYGYEAGLNIGGQAYSIIDNDRN